jgi:hypothetical protein
MDGRSAAQKAVASAGLMAAQTAEALESLTADSSVATTVARWD